MSTSKSTKHSGNAKTSTPPASQSKLERAIADLTQFADKKDALLVHEQIYTCALSSEEYCNLPELERASLFRMYNILGDLIRASYTRQNN
jgi:hypothetical protein